jgi:DNA-3-methyladenine glycosylase II
MTDAEVEALLTEVPGIGPWTARGFLLVGLDRPDVFLSGDLALRRAVQRAYGFDHRRQTRRWPSSPIAGAPIGALR